MADMYGYSAMPGQTDASVTTERWALWGGASWYLLKSIVIDSAAVDASNTPTTELRHGLLMGVVTATGRFKEYNPAGTDGSQKAQGFLWEARKMTDSDGNLVNRQGQLVVCGPVQAARLLLLDQQARGHMHGRFIFDDDLVGANGVWNNVVVKTAAYAVTAADTGTVFTTRGAVASVTFTLPTLARGLRYRFIAEADQNLVVTGSAADLLVATNDLAATSVSYATAGQKIGGSLEVMANDNATKWLVFPMGPNALTVTA